MHWWSIYQTTTRHPIGKKLVDNWGVQHWETEYKYIVHTDPKRGIGEWTLFEAPTRLHARQRAKRIGIKSGGRFGSLQECDSNQRVGFPRVVGDVEKQICFHLYESAFLHFYSGEFVNIQGWRVELAKDVIAIYRYKDPTEKGLEDGG